MDNPHNLDPLTPEVLVTRLTEGMASWSTHQGVTSIGTRDGKRYVLVKRTNPFEETFAIEVEGKYLCDVAKRNLKELGEFLRKHPELKTPNL
jgi:hypothetical protein